MEIERLQDVTIRVTFANASFVEKNPDAVRAFFRAHQKALDFMFDNRPETVKQPLPQTELDRLIDLRYLP